MGTSAKKIDAVPGEASSAPSVPAVEGANGAARKPGSSAAPANPPASDAAKPGAASEAPAARPSLMILAPVGASFEKIREQLKGDAAFSVKECKAYPDARQVFQAMPLAVLCIHLHQKDDIVRHITLLKGFHDEIKAGVLKPVLIHGRIPDDILNLYSKHGCREFVKEPIVYKSISFKFKKMIGGLESKLKKKSGGGALEVKRKIGSGRTDDGEKAQQKAHAKWVAVENYEADCWITGGVEPKWVMNKWILKVHGPGPTTGKWVAVEEKEARKADAQLWRWTPAENASFNFVRMPGTWMFRGRRPDFIGEQWVFVSTRLELFFTDESGERRAFKVRPGQGNDIEVARDTPYAVGIREDVIESLNQVLKSRSLHTPEEEAELKKRESERLEQKRAELPKLFEGDPRALVAFAFVLSELMRLPNLDAKEVCDRIFSFVDREMQGKRVEFWRRARADDAWKPIGSSDRKACEAYFAMEHLDQPVKIFEDHTLVCSLPLGERGEQGAVVVRGHRLNEVSEGFISTFTELFRGLFLSLV